MQGKIFAYIATIIIFSGYAVAYDQPNFDAPLFEPDGLSLSGKNRESVVKLLNAIGADAEADEDLKERAIGIALQLSPLDSDARLANDALMRESNPAIREKAPGPRKIADLLWDTALDLLKDRPSPEDAKLAPLLMEISLIVDPLPASERVWRFGEISEYKPLKWEPFVSLQRDTNLSNRKVPDLFAALKKNRKKEPKTVKSVKPPVVMSVDTPSAPPTTPPTVEGPVSEIKIESGRIATVLQAKDGPVPVYVNLKVREPSTDEASLFSVFAPDGSAKGEFEMRVLPAPDMPVELVGVEKAVEVIKERYPRWPDNKIGEVSLTTPLGGALPPTVSGSVRVMFPVSLLLEQAFSGSALSQDYLVLNEASKKDLIDIRDVRAVMKATASFGSSTKGLISSESFPSLLEAAVVNDDISDFVTVSLIGVEDMKALLEIIRGNSTLPIEEAAVEFSDFLLAKPSTLSVSEYARNEAAIGYLETLVAKYPFHLSARLMLDFGSKQPSAELLTKRSIAQIDAVLKPFAKHYGAAIDPEGGTVVTELSGEFRDATSALRTLRDSTPQEAMQYLRYAEDVLRAMNIFLAIKNKTSSNGEQRHGELKEAIRVFTGERTRLGIE